MRDDTTIALPLRLGKRVKQVRMHGCAIEIVDEPDGLVLNVFPRPGAPIAEKCFCLERLLRPRLQEVPDEAGPEEALLLRLRRLARARAA